MSSRLKTILCVDDYEKQRALVRTTLGAGGFRLLEAGDGEEALAVARREHPDLVLLDVGMPDLDGVAVCRALKSDAATASIKIVMLTAWDNPADRERGMAAGADEYVTKPFSPLWLLNRVHELLR